MPTFFPRTLSHKVSTALCTIRPGIAHMVQIMASIADPIAIPCQSHIATPRRKIIKFVLTCSTPGTIRVDSVNITRC